MGYKNFVGSRRASWRILSALEDKEKTKGRDENAAKIADYRSKVEEELEKICAEIIDMLKEGDSEDGKVGKCGRGGDVGVLLQNVR